MRCDRPVTRNKIRSAVERRRSSARDASPETHLGHRNRKRKLSLRDLCEPVSELGPLLRSEKKLLERPDLLRDGSRGSSSVASSSSSSVPDDDVERGDLLHDGSGGEDVGRRVSEGGGETGDEARGGGVRDGGEEAGLVGDAGRKTR